MPRSLSALVLESDSQAAWVPTGDNPRLVEQLRESLLGYSRKVVLLYMSITCNTVLYRYFGSGAGHRLGPYRGVGTAHATSSKRDDNALLASHGHPRGNPGESPLDDGMFTG